ERHEALRVTLSGDGASLCVAAHLTIALAERDLSALDQDARRVELERARRDAVCTPFDLVGGPLLRAQLLKQGDREHVLLFTAHHLICDGWSSSVLVDDLSRLYSARVAGRANDLPPATPFSEYAALREAEARTAESAADRDYWRALYRTLPAPLDLPLDYPRTPERSFSADRVDFPLAPELIRSLKKAAAQHGASVATLLFAAFQAFIQRISGQRSFSIVVPAAGQSISGRAALVGHCVRSLPVRAEVDPNQPFHEHTLAVKRALLDALDHPRITFGGLVKELPLARDPSRIPLASIMFNVDSNVTVPKFEGLDVRLESVPRAYESFELFVSIALSGDEATVEACFCTRLFERRSIERRMAEFATLLASVAQEPTRVIRELEIMPAPEKAEVLNAINRTEVELPTRTLCASFRSVAALHPERVAVRSHGRALTYAELARASAALAQELVSAGVGPGSFVGVYLSRSSDVLVALLGILRAGAAYVPLDPDYPQKRLEFIAQDARLELIVAERGLASRVPSGARVLFVDDPHDLKAPDLDASRLNAPAYVIYTSGSTGEPKGVIVLHRNVANFLNAMSRAPGMAASDVMVAVTTPSFDISVLELFLPLTVGAELVIATQEQVSDGRLLARLLTECKATVMQATPAGWRVLLESGWAGRSQLKALTGGEALSSELATELRGRSHSLWNCYGPTETTVWSTVEQVRDSVVTIGRPIDNTRVYVLDPALQPVPPGVIGELYIGGAGVSRGYHDRPELTSERFLPDPFAAEPDARMYKTGDLVRLRWDGRLEWLGRRDFQVKVRGHRIELGEIEARLSQLRGVREGVVIVREDRPGDQRIVAYVRPDAELEPSEQRLQQELRDALPSYMVPQHVVLVSAFPLTPNGKVDRKALPAPEAGSTTSYQPPETEIEQQLALEFSDLLGAARVGLDDDFFSLGGHSMLALKLVARTRALWGIEVPMRVVFSTPTLKGLSDFIQAALVIQRGSGIRATSGPQEREELVL
ncbi:MAG TPA: amino acid adenylation domain-containing protein, partial [Polyangiaceae bacterium]|nr:amino acid adenylation domain-containing protein [Polyangiaceae bacterium]